MGESDGAPRGGLKKVAACYTHTCPSFSSIFFGAVATNVPAFEEKTGTQNALFALISPTRSMYVYIRIHKVPIHKQYVPGTWYLVRSKPSSFLLFSSTHWKALFTLNGLLGEPWSQVPLLPLAPPLPVVGALTCIAQRAQRSYRSPIRIGC